MSGELKPRSDVENIIERGMAGEEISPAEIARVRRMYKEAGSSGVADLVSDSDITVLYRQSREDLSSRGTPVIDSMVDYRSLRLGDGLLKIGDQILRFQGNINPLDPAIFDDAERPQLSADIGDAASYAEDLEEEK